MALPIRPTNPITPIPNNPFYTPETTFFCGPYYPAIINATSGLCVNSSGVVNVTGGGGGGGGVTALAAGPGIALSVNTGNITVCTNLVAGSNIALTPSGNQITVSATGVGTGTVTLVAAGNGLSGGPITTSGSLSLNTNCVIQPSAFAIKGNLLVGTSAGTYLALNPGTDGQVLVACGASNASGLCWGSVGSVTSVSGVAPISVATGTTTPTVSIASASTTAAGAVQLNDTLTSTSTALALTAAQGKVLQDQIDTLLVAGTVELAGTIDASTGLVASVTSVGTADGYTVNANLPAASSTTNNTYVIVTTPGSMTPPGGPLTAATRGDWFLVSETSPGTFTWTFLNVGFDAPAASTAVPGIVELATNAETATGTDATTAVTPAGAAFAYIPKSALTAKGVLISATAASTPSALGVGTDGQVLAACAAATTGLCWTAPAATGIPCACITAKGSLVSGTAAATPTALPVGTDGDVLVACATASTGLCWIAPPPSGIPCACVLGKGALVTGTAGSTPAGLGVGLDGQFLVACAAATTGLCWLTVPSTVPATPTVLGTVLGCTNATNAALGCNALAANITGTGNVAIGLNAFCTSTVGVNNVFIGNCAGTVNLGSGSVGVGTAALRASTTSGRNVALGEAAACSNILGECITAIGWNALSATTGGCNTALGYCAGANITTGAQNVVIGPGAAAVSATGSCQLSIGFSATCNWLTGDGTKAIRPGAGIVDCTGSCGTASQVLTSTGSNGLCWTTIPVATPTTLGTILGRIDLGSGGLGFKALCSLTTGNFNIGIGESAGLAITSGCRNVAIGVLALATQTTTNDNVGIGAEALRRTTTGFNNVAIGTTTLVFNTTGADNVAVGYDASRANTTGFQNVAIGVGAMYANNTYGQNTAVGTGALRNYNGGTNGANDAFGALAMCNFIAGDYNVALGAYSLFCYTSGCFNTAVGHRSMTDVTTGACNTAIGAYSGQGLTTGVCNTAVGYAAQVLNGNNNTVLGNGAANVSGASNSITLGNSSISVIRAQVTSITALSDARDKTDVTALPVGLDFINSLNPVRFTWQMREPNEVKDGTSEAGFIAQDLRAAQAAAGADYLGLVYDEDPEKLEASAGKLIPVLVKAIQELSSQNKDLESRLAQMEAGG